MALKIIKLGMDTKQVIARFEAERQAWLRACCGLADTVSEAGEPFPRGPKCLFGVGFELLHEGSR